MNKIVHAHFPVEELPKRLQPAIGSSRRATVTVETEPEPEAGQDTEEVGRQGHFGRFTHLKRANFASADEVNAHISALRD